MTPIRRQGMTEPSLVMVIPEKPALQPDKVKELEGAGFTPEMTPNRGSPEVTLNEVLLKASAL